MLKNNVKYFFNFNKLGIIRILRIIGINNIIGNNQTKRLSNSSINFYSEFNYFMFFYFEI